MKQSCITDVVNLGRLWEFITVFTLGDKLNVINVRNADLLDKNDAVQLHQMRLEELQYLQVNL